MYWHGEIIVHFLLKAWKSSQLLPYIRWAPYLKSIHIWYRLTEFNIMLLAKNAQLTYYGARYLYTKNRFSPLKGELSREKSLPSFCLNRIDHKKWWLFAKKLCKIFHYFVSYSSLDFLFLSRVTSHGTNFAQRYLYALTFLK